MRYWLLTLIAYSSSRLTVNKMFVHIVEESYKILLYSGHNVIHKTIWQLARALEGPHMQNGLTAR